MAAVTNATIKLKAAFADETTREVTLGPIDANADVITNVKTNIATFNSNINNLQGLYLSEGGATCTGISAATLTVETDDPINLNDAE